MFDNIIYKIVSISWQFKKVSDLYWTFSQLCGIVGVTKEKEVTLWYYNH